MFYWKRTRDYLLHLNAQRGTMRFAKDLRREMTKAEEALWKALKNRQLGGIKFRRQHPIHWYVADFYCHEKRLIVEVDGGIHLKKDIREHDDNRSAELDRLGITVLRFTNDEVLNHMSDVLQKIQSTAESLQSQ